MAIFHSYVELPEGTGCNGGCILLAKRRVKQTTPLRTFTRTPTHEPWRLRTDRGSSQWLRRFPARLRRPDWMPKSWTLVNLWCCCRRLWDKSLAMHALIVAYTPWHRNSEFFHNRWWFSRVMLVYQRVILWHPPCWCFFLGYHQQRGFWMNISTEWGYNGNIIGKMMIHTVHTLW